MKGLLLKDFKTVFAQGKLLMLLIAFYLVFSVVTKSFSIFGALAVVFCAVMPVTALAYDERSKWDRFSFTLPLSRKALVGEKYLFGIMLTLPIILLECALEVFFSDMPAGDIIGSAAISFALGIFLLALSLPLSFWLGVEKGRIAIMVVFCGSAIAASSLLDNLSSLVQPDSRTAAAAVLGMLILLGLSFYISVCIYRRKQF